MLSPKEAQDGVKVSFSLEDEILAEHFTRNVQFFGREGQQRIMGSFVVVIGLGVSSSFPNDDLALDILHDGPAEPAMLRQRAPQYTPKVARQHNSVGP